MRSWLLSLQFRLIAAFSLALALTLGGVSLYIGYAAQRQAESLQQMQEQARAARVERMVADRYARSGGFREVQLALEQAGVLYGDRIILWDEDDRLIGDSHSRFAAPPRPQHGGRMIPVVVEGGRIGTLFVLPREPGLQPVPQDVQPTPDEPAFSRMALAVNRLLLWSGVLAGLGGILLVGVISRRVLAPAYTLADAARRLGHGDLSQRVPTSGPSEIRQLAHTFNAMAENLQRAEQQRRNLVADVAHELRTPLSNIQGYLEAIRDALLEPDRATMDTIYQEVLHLAHLVEDLRLLALAEAGSLRLDLQPDSLVDVLRRSVDAVRPRAEAKGLTISLDVEPGLPLAMVDRTRVSQVAGILLDNAIFHTPPGGSVTVSAESGTGMARVTVADTGEGIPPDKLDLIFERFYRVDPSRTRGTGGTGLGLTIARQLVQMHGGAIRAESATGNGVRIVFELPLA